MVSDFVGATIKSERLDGWCANFARHSLAVADANEPVFHQYLDPAGRIGGYDVFPVNAPCQHVAGGPLRHWRYRQFSCATETQ